MTPFLRACLSARTNYILWCLLVWSSLLTAQRNPVYSFKNTAPVIEDNQLLKTVQENQLAYETEDSCVVINLIESYILPELSRQFWQNIDTTKQLIELAMSIAQRINYDEGIKNLRRCLGSAYTAKGPQDSARFYLRHSIQQMKDNRDTGRLAFFLLQYARSCEMSSKFDSAIYYAEKAAYYAHSIDKPIFYLNALSTVARYHAAKGDYIKCVELSHNNVDLGIQLKDSFCVVTNSRNLANIYHEMAIPDREMEAAQTALLYGRNSKHTLTKFNAYLAISEAYHHHQKFDSAIHYAWKNINLLYRGGQNMTHLTLGSIYRDCGLIDSAIFHIQRYINATYEYNAIMRPDAYSLLASCNFISGDYQKATSHYHLAEAQIKPEDELKYRNIYESLYKCYDQLNHPQKALHYLEKFNGLEDSMKLSQKSFGIAMLEGEKQADKLEGQIHLLTENNKLQIALNREQRQQKNMVYGSSAVILALALMGFLRFRKQKELKSKQSLLNERLRISRDLHDEVGATLSGIAMYSHIAKEQMKTSDTAEVAYSLDIMQKSADEMVTKLSDIVWLINPDQDTIHQLFDRLEDYAQEMALLKNMILKMYIAPSISDFHLPLEGRRNIYLFCKEGINNAIKYSHGKVIELRAAEEQGYLRFSVKDDGIGFDEMSIKKGNGLNNLKHRAEEIGAKFELQSVPFYGTKVELSYKLTH